MSSISQKFKTLVAIKANGYDLSADIPRYFSFLMLQFQLQYLYCHLFLNIHSTVPTQNLHRSRTSCSTATTSQNIVSLEWIFQRERERKFNLILTLFKQNEGCEGLLFFWRLLKAHSGGCYEIEVPPSIIVRCQGRNLLPKDLESTQ